MQCVQIHATARAWPRRLHDAPKTFSLQHLWPVPQQWVPPPPSSFMVSPEKLHFRRAGSSWPWSNSNTIYKSDQCSFQKSLSFDVSDTYHLNCTNVLQNGSWVPQPAIPSCVFLRRFGSLILRKLHRGTKRKGVTGTSDGRAARLSPVWQAPPDLHCGHRLVFDICISTANWIRPASRRSSQACANCTTQAHRYVQSAGQHHASRIACAC